MIIDGSIGEGGGQILRTSLSLAAITGTEIRIEKIRAKRETPGLKRQHLACVMAAAEICNAKVSDITVGTTEIDFLPEKIKAGDYRFDVGTAGSVTLVAQTVIPILLMADGESTVTISGGTHVDHAPTWEFFELCYLPELRRMGAEISAEIKSYGFYPAAGGVISLKIKAFDKSRRPDRFELTELGKYRGGKVVGVVSSIPRDIAMSEVDIVAKNIHGLECEVGEVSSNGPGNYCYVRLDYERASIVFSGIGVRNRSRKSVANEIVHNVKTFLKSGKACEEHIADQLLLPGAILLKGWSDKSSCCFKLDLQKESLHYKTNKEVIEMFIKKGVL